METISINGLNVSVLDTYNEKEKINEVRMEFTINGDTFISISDYKSLEQRDQAYDSCVRGIVKQMQRSLPKEVGTHVRYNLTGK